MQTIIKEKVLMQLMRELRLDQSKFVLFQHCYKPCCLCGALGRPNYKTAAALVKTSTERGPWANRYLCETCFQIVCQYHPNHETDCLEAVEKEVKPIDPDAGKLDQTWGIVELFGTGTTKELIDRAKKAAVEIPENFHQHLFALAQKKRLHRWKANRVWVYSLSPAPEGAIEEEILSNRRKAVNFLRQFGDGVTAQELKERVLAAGETLDFDLGAALSVMALPKTKTNKLIAKRTMSGVNRYWLPETLEGEQRHAS